MKFINQNYTDMKTFKKFIENFSSNPDLHKKAWKMGGVEWGEFKKYPEDYYDASTGSVPGTIYYSDTVPFAKKNEAEILRALREFESECGALKVPSIMEDGETTYYNWLTWFAWENMAGELISYLED